MLAIDRAKRPFAESLRAMSEPPYIISIIISGVETVIF